MEMILELGMMMLVNFCFASTNTHIPFIYQHSFPLYFNLIVRYLIIVIFAIVTSLWEVFHVQRDACITNQCLWFRYLVSMGSSNA